MTPKPGGERSRREPEGQPQERAVPGASESYGLQEHSWILQQLHQTTLEIGKLTANVDRLINDVKSQGDKIDALRQQATFIKGAIWAGVALVGLFIWIASAFLSSKWDAAVQAIRAVVK